MTTKRRPQKLKAGTCSIRFEAARIESLFDVMDAVAWLNLPTVSQIAQFAGIDPRTAGKLIKNGVAIGVVETLNEDRFGLLRPYPNKAPLEQKQQVIREALVLMPLLKAVRQFLKLGDKLDDALRKAAAVQQIQNFEPAALAPLIVWAKALNALDPNIDAEDLVDEGIKAKDNRHQQHSTQRVVFLSHSSKDKPQVRQLATDLTAAGVTVWLDEQKIRVGDSIPERVSQGLAESDFFLIALTAHSVQSEWVKKELNSALIEEIARRKVKVLPVLLTPTEIPTIIADKKYADFTLSYKQGLADLLSAINSDDADKGQRK